MDMITDVLVVYTWIIDDHFYWAIFQLSFVLMGQFYSALMIFHIKYANNNNNNKKSYFDIIEILITLFGFGKLWYGAKTLKNSQTLSFFKKLKIWEIIFESFPSVALAFFISVAENELYSRSVLLSFIVSFFNIAMTVMLIMFKDRSNSNIDQENNEKGNNFNKDVEITSWRAGKKSAATKENKVQLELQLHLSPENSNCDQDSDFKKNKLCMCLSCCSIVKTDTYKDKNTIASDDMWIVDKKTGYVKFKFEKKIDEQIRCGKKKTSGSKKAKKVECEKIANCLSSNKKIFCNLDAIKAIGFYIIIWLFIVTDLFVRITPPIMFYTILRVSFSIKLAAILSAVLLFIGFVTQCVIIYPNLFRRTSNNAEHSMTTIVNGSNNNSDNNNNNNNVEFILLFSGLITNSYYWWSCIGLDYLPFTIDFDVFLKQQYSRILICTLIEIVVIMFQIVKNRWYFIDMVIVYFIILIFHLCLLLKITKLKPLGR